MENINKPTTKSTNITPTTNSVGKLLSISSQPYVVNNIIKRL